MFICFCLVLDFLPGSSHSLELSRCFHQGELVHRWSSWNRFDVCVPSDLKDSERCFHEFLVQK